MRLTSTEALGADFNEDDLAALDGYGREIAGETNPNASRMAWAFLRGDPRWKGRAQNAHELIWRFMKAERVRRREAKQ